MTIPEMHLFENEKDIAPYVVTSKHTVTAFDVEVYKLYRQANPSVPQIAEGQEIEILEKPYGYFEYQGTIWPVYDDDSGQQSYIYINGKALGAGAYTMYPYDIEYFCHEIDEYFKSKEKKNDK